METVGDVSRAEVIWEGKIDRPFIGDRPTWARASAPTPRPRPAACTGPSERLKLRPSEQRNIHKPSDGQPQPYPFIEGRFDATPFPSADWRECVLESLQGRALRRWAPDHIDRDDESLVERIHRRLLPVPPLGPPGAGRRERLRLSAYPGWPG